MFDLLRKQQHMPVTSLALPRGQFITRDYTDATGQQFRLTFFVTMVDGEVRGRLVSAQPTGKSYEIGAMRLEGSCSGSAFCLPSASHKLLPHTSYLLSPALLVSPYTELFFFMSQPTRAPSYAEASEGKPSRS